MKELRLFSGKIKVEERLKEMIMAYELMFNVELNENEIEVFKQAYKMGIKDGGEDTYIKISEQI